MGAVRTVAAARVAATAALLAAITLPGAAHAQAGPPTDPACVPLATGSTGLLYVNGSIPTGDQVAGRHPGGFGPVVPAAVAATLPDAVVFKSATQTFSAEYAFVLRDGHVFVRPAVAGAGVAGQRWRTLKLPACLDGHVSAISADGRLLLALGPGRQLYSNDMPQGDISPERWTWRWGPYFWTGAGIRLWDDVRTFAASEFTSSEHFTDTAGRTHAPLGVATVYLLRGDGRRITYLDPWLPPDDSRQVCGPRRGTVPLAGLSGSGSTVFVVSRRGELFTRLYDFDVSGANTVFGAYTWSHGVPAGDTRWQLPGPGWVRHRRPPGRITDRITLARTGTTAADRVMRVEGLDRRGRHGYWEAPIGGGTWRFVRTGAPLQGRRLPLPAVTAPAPDDRAYAGTVGGAPAAVTDFNPECSPATLHVQVAPDHGIDLVLHTSDGLRQETRAGGLDDTPREYNGAIEVPAAVAADPDPRVRTWLAAVLGAAPVTVAPVAVTQTRLRFLRQCWQLTRDGRPARPDVARVPPDLGAVVGRVTEARQDGWTPGVC